jgi:predicted RNA-binding protein
MNCWLCVSNEENWAIIKKRKLWGVSKKNRRQMDEVKVGDILVFYIKPKKIAGIYKVAAKPFVGNEKIFSSAGFLDEETFPYRVKLEKLVEPKEPIPFDNLVPCLNFISNKKKWPGHLRKAMQVIPKGDYEKILASLDKS